MSETKHTGDRPACCLTEAGLECPRCGWFGCEETGVLVDLPDDSRYECPRCGEWTAHTPHDEIEHWDGHPCMCVKSPKE